MAEPKLLPADAAFVAETVQRSMPNRDRPRMKTESEKRLAAVERKSAAQYASMETYTHHFNKLADEMDEEHKAAVIATLPDEPDGSIPEECDWEDSMGHNIDETRQKLIK